jgi:hypothetical protein
MLRKLLPFFRAVLQQFEMASELVCISNLQVVPVLISLLSTWIPNAGVGASLTVSKTH